jgi:hypothetical protein
MSISHASVLAVSVANAPVCFKNPSFCRREMRQHRRKKCAMPSAETPHLCAIMAHFCVIMRHR